MNLHNAIIQLNPQVTAIRGEVAYDANEQVVEYDLAAAEALVASKEYQRQRAVAYPAIQDQLDTLYHGGYEVWKATITAVKEEFPKP
jgi:hypothetical protein